MLIIRENRLEEGGFRGINLKYFQDFEIVEEKSVEKVVAGLKASELPLSKLLH